MWARSSFLFALVLLAQSPNQKPAKPARGPIAVYEEACARCHGPNGSFYGPELGRGKTDLQLRQAIQDMADNQGQIELTLSELDAQTAYHRAIIAHEPFLYITEQTEKRLAGEVTAGSRVQVVMGGKPQKITQNKTLWSATLASTGPVELSATLGKAITKLDPAKNRFSHSPTKFP
jgi:hypothetical protein